MVISLSKKTLAKNKINTLKSFLDSSNSLSYIPVVTNNVIQINTYQIHEHDDGFFVYESTSDKMLTVTTTKSAALAFVKNCLCKGKLEHTIKTLDYIIAKNKIDEIFYKQTVKNTKNKEHKFIAQTRLQIAQQDIHVAKKELYDIIFNF